MPVRSDRHFYVQLFDLTACSRAIYGDGDAGFGEGFHVIEHVQCGIDDLDAQAGNTAAFDAHTELQQCGLGMKDIRFNGRAQRFRIAGDDFCRFIIENDEGIVMCARDDGAEQRRGIRLKLRRCILQKFLRLPAKASIFVKKSFTQGFGFGACGIFR